jgi:1-pyrroline-4-hydroxy-2-carboxylate deaminase
MSITWQGIFPALTTKFTSDDKLDFALQAKSLDAQIAAGVHGIILGGTLGESSVLTNSEKEALVKFTVSHVNGKIPVLINIAEGATVDAIQLAKNAKDWGAQGLMALPPMRYKTDHRETVTYFTAIANNTDLPIMIYNNPVDYKTEVTVAMFEELLKLENIQAVKDSTRDLSNVTRYKNAFGNRLKILSGVDTIAIESLLMGADGWVGGLVCAFPEETVAIYNLVKAGRVAEAVEIQRWFLPLLELDIHAKLVQYIKLAEEHTGLGSAYVRAPRLTLIGDELAQVTKTITDGIASRPTLPTL